MEEPVEAIKVVIGWMNYKGIPGTLVKENHVF